MIQICFFQSLETLLNEQLCNINKLSLNTDKSNFVVFHPPQKKFSYSINLKINNKIIKKMSSIKYLGIFMDCNSNWKDHVHEYRSIGILLKLRNFVTIDILIFIYRGWPKKVAIIENIVNVV